PIIGIFGPLNLWTPLIFDALNDYDEYKIIYIFPYRDDSYLRNSLAQCNILIMAANPFDVRSEYALNLCSFLRIPVYYLHDHAASLALDHLNEFAEHDEEKVEDFLARVTGSLCSSQATAYDLRKNIPDHAVYEV